MASFRRVVFTFQPRKRRVRSITVRFVAVDVQGTIWITDVMLQGGRLATLWAGHPSEIRWSFDGS
jgi:hypothetical protein|uniref:Uncharacterized protein n=1 Tax=Thermorudis peleae TaxID=1382356 RepID=A0A831TG79_9BACT